MIRPQVLLHSILVLLLMTTSIPAQSPLVGAWLGGFRVSADAQPIIVIFSPDGGVLGSAMMPAARVNTAPVTAPTDPGRFKSPAFTLSWRGEILTFEVEGQEPAFLSGTVTRGTDRGSFELAPMVSLAPDLRRQYEGVYWFDDGERVYLQTLDFAGSSLALCDRMGTFRVLQPLSDTTFAVGTGAFLPLPRAAMITLGSGAIRWESMDGEVRRGRQIAARREFVRFQSGHIELVGELLLPESPGPHPCIVSVHGSGPQGRNVLPFTALLVDRGYAVLGYDKRGVGESGGTWTAATMEDLAGDAVAAVNYVRGRSDIRADAIGLVGISQGSWIAMIAASRSDDVAFVVSLSGAATTPAEQELDRVRLEMSADGYEQAEIVEALDLYRRLNEYVHTGTGWDELQQTRLHALDRNWIPNYFDVPPAPDHWLVGFWKGMLDYDPVPAMRQVRCPILALWGGRDLNVPAEKNRALWDQKIADGVDNTSVIFPRGNHLLLEATSGSLMEWPRLTRFVPGYLDTLVSWLDQRVAP